MMIVGEAWGEQEELYEKPFVGPSGHLLRNALAHAGVSLDDCYLTNVFNFRPPGNSIEALCDTRDIAIPDYVAYHRGKYIRNQYAGEIERLWQEVEDQSPNVILSLGATALWALCNVNNIKKHRGYLTQTCRGNTKVVPSWHPAAVLRMYSLYPVLMTDAVKAAKHDAYPEIPEQQGFVCVPETISELRAWIDTYVVPAEEVVCDIETEKETITEVGFAVSKERALVIPFFLRPNKSYWPTAEEEIEAWRLVKWICENKKLVGQNFAYDMKYLWQKMGIACPGFIDDTMLMHHSLQPEMEKGLGFLASLYTDRPAWKHMRAESKTSKKGD